MNVALNLNIGGSLNLGAGTIVGGLRLTDLFLLYHPNNGDDEIMFIKPNVMTGLVLVDKMAFRYERQLLVDLIRENPTHPIRIFKNAVYDTEITNTTSFQTYGSLMAHFNPLGLY